MSPVAKVNLHEQLGRIREHWKPRIAGELNGQQVKLVKFLGEFVWHHHEHEDELFLVVKGRFRMDFRDRSVWLEEGEFLIVPRGIEHRPVGRRGRGPGAPVRASLDAEHRQRPGRADHPGARADLTRPAGSDRVGSDHSVVPHAETGRGAIGSGSSGHREAVGSAPASTRAGSFRTAGRRPRLMIAAT